MRLARERTDAVAVIAREAPYAPERRGARDPRLRSWFVPAGCHGTFVASAAVAMIQPSIAAPPTQPRANQILAKTIYRELTQSGLSERDVVAIASELLSLVATDMKSRRDGAPSDRR